MPEPTAEEYLPRRRRKKHWIQLLGGGAEIEPVQSISMRGYNLKMLLMSLAIVFFIGLFVRRDAFITKEGTFKIAYALTFACIWNGCFNAILTFCRERKQPIKLSVSSICVQCLRQTALCFAQSVILISVCWLMGTKLNEKGLLLPALGLELCVTVFLITWTADLLCLLLSSLFRSTFHALFALPFVLAFQVLFSGGLLALPAWAQPISAVSISQYAVRCIAAQGEINHLPLASVWNTLSNMRDTTLDASITVGQVIDYLKNEENSLINSHREDELTGSISIGDALSLFGVNRQNNTEKEPAKTTIWQRIASLLRLNTVTDRILDKKIQGSITLGDGIDMLTHNAYLEQERDREITLKIRLGDVYDALGEDRVQTFIQQKSAFALQNAGYAHTIQNIIYFWLILAAFALVYLACTFVSAYFQRTFR